VSGLAVQHFPILFVNLGLGVFFHSLFSVNAGSFIPGPLLNLNIDLTPCCPYQTHHRIDVFIHTVLIIKFLITSLWQRRLPVD
jgi:hypothetical protein